MFQFDGSKRRLINVYIYLFTSIHYRRSYVLFACNGTCLGKSLTLSFFVCDWHYINCFQLPTRPLVVS